MDTSASRSQSEIIAIEVNGTGNSTFKPPTLAKWRDETPEGSMFSLKVNRFAMHRRVTQGRGEAGCGSTPSRAAQSPAGPHHHRVRCRPRRGQRTHALAPGAPNR
ncbi:hypothetical protein DBR12_01150 [Acidovorax sp. HMWF029]|uniref:DUF72 domain-containing protein n=1 Tax=Acidovorax sp. HMWF029 TaxID=2056863 RepID=UPI000D3A6E7F|nr:hypothetical protein DBR12_01150 [Acidovorax sp. HMWF029]